MICDLGAQGFVVSRLAHRFFVHNYGGNVNNFKENSLNIMIAVFFICVITLIYFIIGAVSL